jgi:hypothetical protein
MMRAGVRRRLMLRAGAACVAEPSPTSPWRAAQSSRSRVDAIALDLEATRRSSDDNFDAMGD